MITRVERHIIKNPSHSLLSICHKAKNLYNYVNYIIRQKFFASESIPSDVELINTLTQENQADYRSLPAQTAQQVIRLLSKNWKAFFSANTDYAKNPEKYKGLPSIPKYKDKDGFSIAIFTNQQVKLKRGEIHFPKPLNLPPLQTRVDSFQQVRIVPQATCFVMEVVYQKESTPADVCPENILTIDFGLDNLATCVNNVGMEPFIVNGKVLKAINQFYNKQKAKFQSDVGDRSTSNRIKGLTYKRNQKIEDSLHKVSAHIRNWCIEHQIGMVIIGKNKNWKQELSLGKRTNQNFVSIPFHKLIAQLQYKLADVGIVVSVTEESYTSKIDHFAKEEMKHQESYLGKRKKRGLFQSSIGKLVNADVNGAIGIARKVVGDGFVQNLFGRGCGFQPVRMNAF